MREDFEKKARQDRIKAKRARLRAEAAEEKKRKAKDDAGTPASGDVPKYDGKVRETANGTSEAYSFDPELVALTAFIEGLSGRITVQECGRILRATERR